MKLVSIVFLSLLFFSSFAKTEQGRIGPDTDFEHRWSDSFNSGAIIHTHWDGYDFFYFSNYAITFSYLHNFAYQIDKKTFLLFSWFVNCDIFLYHNNKMSDDISITGYYGINQYDTMHFYVLRCKNDIELDYSGEINWKLLGAEQIDSNSDIFGIFLWYLDSPLSYFINERFRNEFALLLKNSLNKYSIKKFNMNGCASLVKKNWIVLHGYDKRAKFY